MKMAPAEKNNMRRKWRRWHERIEMTKEQKQHRLKRGLTVWDKRPKT